MPSIETDFGTFVASVYRVNDTGDGVVIHLLFEPGDRVDASKIAMIQTTAALVDGAPVFGDEDTMGPRRALPAGAFGAGAHIDQDAGIPSPLYAVGSQPEGSYELGAGLTDARFGAFGARFFHSDSGLVVVSASLRDVTFLRLAGASASQRFETTCLAVEGEQADVYYGSVSWGWERGPYGAIELLPLSLESADSTSAVFRRAVELWNVSSTSGGDPVLRLPLPGA